MRRVNRRKLGVRAQATPVMSLEAFEEKAFPLERNESAVILGRIVQRQGRVRDGRVGYVVEGSCALARDEAIEVLRDEEIRLIGFVPDFDADFASDCESE